MKPLDRRKVKFPGKRDVHPGKDLANWWEDMHEPNKGSERLRAKREIEDESKQAGWGEDSSQESS